MASDAVVPWPAAGAAEADDFDKFHNSI